VLQQLMGDPSHATEQPPRFLMCPPKHYRISYRINPWMDPAAWAASAEVLAHEADRGWRQLYNILRQLGAVIEIMPADPGLPDLVFTANCAVVLNRKALLARFRHPERQGEERCGRAFLERLAKADIVEKIYEMPKGVCFEGAGDCRWDPHRGVIWQGWGQRSAKKAKAVIERIYNVPVVSLELVTPHFYHLDTAFCVLSGGEVLYTPQAFSQQGVATIKDLVDDAMLIGIPDQDAKSLAANAVTIGADVIFGFCGEQLEQELTDRRYRVHRVPLSSFALSGGSAFCLTLRLDDMTLTDRTSLLLAAAETPDQQYRPIRTH
jgi:N-dimethylarginine dimethylaminohydrolase